MNAEMLAMLDYLERERGIGREALVDAISGAILTSARKSFATAKDLRIDISPRTGEIKAFAKPIVVEKIDNQHDQITLAKARQIQPDVQIGDEIEIEVTPRDFGRIAAQTARQAIMQRIRQIEKDMIYEEFKDRAGEIVNGTVRRFDRSDVIIDLGKFEGIMPSKERVPTEEYTIGDRIRAYVVAVENGTRGPEIILSRSHPNFVRRLFEVEVSEISDRTVEIRSIAREAGARTKVAVHSADEKVDPVGACVGMRGARVKNIVRELNNEKVDIIRWYADPSELVKEALKPAKIRSLRLDEGIKKIFVTVSQEELSQAIGRKGQNARLTARLTGWDIDIQEDKSAAQAFENQKTQAANSMADILQISQDEADTLLRGGMNAIEVVVTASAEDIAEMLGCELDKAEVILAAAKAHSTNGLA
jgi:N utilization substance protein A